MYDYNLSPFCALCVNRAFYDLFRVIMIKLSLWLHGIWFTCTFFFGLLKMILASNKAVSGGKGPRNTTLKGRVIIRQNVRLALIPEKLPSAAENIRSGTHENGCRGCFISS